ncbi:MAG: hypothetical protein ACOYI6_04120 [Christensenellales bacterium]|jgi:hypothetical protein
MAYARKRWQDNSVERPRTYTEAVNEDGSKTYTPAFGEVLQEGTPQSATNFNAIEEGLQHTNIAFDLYYVTVQAQMRDLEARLALAEAKLAALP